MRGSDETRITIRLDDDVLGWFRDQVSRGAGGNYLTLINRAPREYVQRERESLEDTLRRIVWEEMQRGRPRRSHLPVGR